MSNWNANMERDYKKGNINEKINKRFIEKYLGTILAETPRYAPFDFKNNDFIVELKCRNCKYGTYADLLMNSSKINYGVRLLDSKRVFFIVRYTDGLYSFELTKENKDLIIGNQFGGRRDRGRDEMRNDKSYIPNNLFNKINLEDL
tara:strand:+ start:188 stop:625 length:438 start_codon:yes stop_codon:yes gene_type:complete